LLLTIEKLIYGGDGLARLPADHHSADLRSGDPRSADSRSADLHSVDARGKAVFVPFVLAGEKIEASLTEQKHGFARAKADAIIQPSSHRISPACPYFGQCGGCHYQHAGYEHQLEIKRQILRETLRRTAKLELDREIEVHPSPPWNYRNRARLQLQSHPNFAVGYFKHASHQLQPVEQCPISSPLINRAIAALWQIGRAKTGHAKIGHTKTRRAGQLADGANAVEFFANHDDTQLLVEFSCAANARRAEVRTWAEELRAALPEIAGIVAFREPQPGSHAGRETLLALGATHLIYHIQIDPQNTDYRVSAGSFFQTNRHLTAELVNVVTQGRSGNLALDLYSGVGLFSTVLARDFHHIVSVESSQTSTADLAYNLPSNAMAVQATAEQYLAPAKNARAENPGQVRKGVILHTSQTPDLVVVDPPRSGLGERVAHALASLRAPQLTYVSCDPATLARDLITLLATGYRVEQVHLVDLFPQTYHLESVVHLTR
jgi:23S rRNA (uracil1939-C5)-methyltransferase